MDELKKLDEVAYVRFASVYRQFSDINTFFEELSELMNDKNIRKSLSSASKLMAEIEKQNAEDAAKKERSKECARERARERRAAAKAAKSATQKNN
jgi:hypothetical protein